MGKGTRRKVATIAGEGESYDELTIGDMGQDIVHQMRCGLRHALARAFTRPVEASLTPDVLGHYFENVVGARFIEAGWDVSYWKQGVAEVDFVVHGPANEHLAIEVKSAEASPAEMAGLKAFCAANKEYEPCLVSLVGQEMPGITSLSAEWVLSLGA